MAGHPEASITPATSAELPAAGRRWLVTGLAMFLPLLLCFVYFVWMPGTAVGNAAYTGIKVWLLAWPVVAGAWLAREHPRGACAWYRLIRLLPGRHPDPAQEETAKARRHSVRVGAGFGVLVGAFAWGMLAVPGVGDAIRESAPQLRKQVGDFGVMDHYFLFGMFIAVVHSWLEEYYWRGFVFGHLRRLVPVWAAHLLAALAFMAHHVVVLHTFFPGPMAWLLSAGVATGGLVWSILYQRHGTLLGAWVSHLVVDVVVIVIGWQLIQG